MIRLITSIDDESPDISEIEFWPERQQAQYREISRQGIVTASRIVPYAEALAHLRSATAEAKGRAP